MLFGAMKIGAVPVPVNTLLTTKDYDFLLRDSRAAVLAVSDTLVEKFRPIISEQPFLKQVLISGQVPATVRSEEHTSELQSLMRISYAVFCLKKKNTTITDKNQNSVK